jgi:excisionase family DNA binding protein
MENEPLITAAEVAEKLKCSEEIVRRWRREGRIPAAVVEKNFIRFRWSEVSAALAKRAQAQPH